MLRIRDLVVEARSESKIVLAVDRVNFEIGESEVVGLIGESGSGKTSLARSILNLHERNVRITHGSIEYSGTNIVDAVTGRSNLTPIRGSQVGMVFQSPRSSLDPLMTIGGHLREILKRHKPGISRAEVKTRSIDVLNEMRLDAKRVLRSYPHQLSGGMCQRAAIAIAIAPYPTLLIADECTSALDVTSQEEVVKVLKHLIDSRRMALLFVTHDMLLASELCDRLVVMQNGKVVESGPTAQILGSPREAYTKRLIAAVPRWSPEGVA